MYYLYLVRCSDDSLYAGITTDVVRRVKEHNGSPVGAKYTKARRPVSLVYQQAYPNRSAALKAEAAIKKLPRSAKLSISQGSRGLTAGEDVY